MLIILSSSLVSHYHANSLRLCNMLFLQYFYVRQDFFFFCVNFLLLYVYENLGSIYGVILDWILLPVCILQRDTSERSKQLGGAFASYFYFKHN